MKNFKTIGPTIIAFLLLFPFRLPISVLLIYAFNNIAQLAGKVVPDNVLCANVVITKLVYNIIFGAWFTVSFEKLIQKLNGRKTSEGMSLTSDPERHIYWYSVAVGSLVCAYVIYDGTASHELFWAIIGKPNPSYL